MSGEMKTNLIWIISKLSIFSLNNAALPNNIIYLLFITTNVHVFHKKKLNFNLRNTVPENFTFGLFGLEFAL